jgi:hypothetical protein
LSVDCFKEYSHTNLLFAELSSRERQNRVFGALLRT